MPLVLWIGAMSFEGPLATVHVCIRSDVLRGTARLRLLGGYGTMSRPGTSMCYPHSHNRDVFLFPAGPAGEAAIAR